MNQKEANRIILRFYSNPNPSSAERFEFEEAMEYMIRTSPDPNYIVGLGSYYRGMGRTDLAMKYFNQAIEMGDTGVYECLAAVYLDEHSGMKDDVRAFECFKKSWESSGSLQAYMEMAEMYRNGWGVEQNQERYQQMIEEMYVKIGHSQYMGDPVSEVCIHLGEIRRDQGRAEEAVDLFLHARRFLARRIKEYALEEDFHEMERLVKMIYEIVEFDETNIDLYDLFYILRPSCSVKFWHRLKQYTLAYVADDEGDAIRFNRQWYRSLTDFMRRGKIDGEPVSKIVERLYGMDFRTCA